MPLKILAGRRAFARIRSHGLSPSDVKAIYGASGAAKWLAIAGLDASIFQDWLGTRTKGVPVFGTSIGAIKLAAAVQPNPRERLEALGRAYIAQCYDGRPTPDAIAKETDRVLDAALGQDGMQHILSNERYQYHCGAVHCHRRLTTTGRLGQALDMTILAAKCLVKRSLLAQDLARVCFYAANQDLENVSHSIFSGADDFETFLVQLTTQNLRSAILASGSIPVYMHGVEMSAQIHSKGGAERHISRQALILRDGGLLDYHPLPENIQGKSHDGILLYPHFYSDLRETWFDKFYTWRKVQGDRLDDVLIVAPSREFVASLKLGRIPDRGDFQRFAGNDAERVAIWTEAFTRSKELGEKWLELCETQDWSSVSLIEA